MPVFEVGSKRSKWWNLIPIGTVVGSVLGAFGSYILGAALVTSSQLLSIADEKTILAIGAQAALLSTITWAVFRLSRPFLIFAYIAGIGVWAMFHVGIRYRKNPIAHPKSTTLQSRRLREFVRREEGKARLLISRLLITSLFVWETMLSSADPVLQWRIAFFLGFGLAMLYLSFSLAFQFTPKGVLKRGHFSFVASQEMLWLLAAAVSIAFFAMGVLRTSHQMNSGEMSVVGSIVPCSLSPLFPVVGGDLFFERESQAFVVVGAAREFVFVVRGPMPDRIESCFR